MREFLESLYEIGVRAAHPDHCFEGHWPPLPDRGRLIILSAGKAGAAMARAAEAHYGDDAFSSGRIEAIAVTRHGYTQPLKHFRLIEAGHPVPDEGSVLGSKALLQAAKNAGENDLVLVLLSGGGSALLSAPVDGLTLADKQDVTSLLLRSGAAIDEINTVRKHLSQIKGGRLAAAAHPATVITLAISDVAGDDPSAIASGPTVADPTTLVDARAIHKRARGDLASKVGLALSNPANETSKPGDADLSKASYTLVATPAISLDAVAKRCSEAGYTAINLGDQITGEARDIARTHAAEARKAKTSGEKFALISGGELSVTIKGDGTGGPNQEYALALAIALDGASGIWALAADTDGADGGRGLVDDPAGAIVDPDIVNRSLSRSLDAAMLLSNNDSTSFFRKAGGLFSPGPTQTNVNDLRIILIEGSD
ncbi:MAG: glycerate kinase [Pseudomonadota bacterium]